MFEDCLIESGGRMKTRKGATVLISTIVHVVLVVVMILIPLISYSELPQQQLLAFLVAPPPPPPPPPPPVVEAAPQPVIVKTVQIDPGAMVAPTEIPKDIVIVRDEGPPPSAVGIVGGTGRSGMLSGVLGGVLKAQEEAAPPPPPPPPPAPPPPQRIRQGGSVMQASLINKVQPVYPPLARQARIQGTVIIEAVISREGTIEELKVISGHPLLQQSAVDAVKQWRYKPTLLNGEPVEVVTTVTVTFSFGG